DGVRVDDPAAHDLEPLGVRDAFHAHRTRIPLAVSALQTLLDQQPPLARRLPVLLVDVVELRQRLRPLRHVDHFVCSHEPGCSLPRMLTPMQESQPPEPAASATLQSGTWASPPWPRSCRTASMTKKMPRMPGWFDERPPPSVLSGHLP